jgi:hypothetical protein
MSELRRVAEKAIGASHHRAIHLFGSIRTRNTFIGVKTKLCLIVDVFFHATLSQ